MVCENEVGDRSHSGLCDVAEVVEAHQDGNIGVKDGADEENELEAAKLVLAVLIAEGRDEVGAEKQGAAAEGKAGGDPVVGAAGDGDSAAVKQSLAFRDLGEVSEGGDDADDQSEERDDGADAADNVNDLSKAEDGDDQNERHEDCKADGHRQTPLLVHGGGSAGRHEEVAAESEEPCHGLAGFADDGACVEGRDLIEVAEVAGAACVCICNVGNVYHDEVKGTDEEAADNSVAGEVLNGFLTGCETGADEECHEGADKYKYATPAEFFLFH